MRREVSSALVLVVSLSACLPSTRFDPIAPEVVRAEELRQQRLVIQWQLQQAQRVEDVGHALLAGAREFCGTTVTTRPGLLLRTAYDFGPELEQAARSLGFSDTLIIAGVARNSAAERAGLRAGARILGYQGRRAAKGRGALGEVTRRLAFDRPVSTVALSIQPGAIDLKPERDSAPELSSGTPDEIVVAKTVAVPSDTACAYGLNVLRDDAVNAYADGRDIIITTGLLRVISDDDELATVIAHEIAHNAKRHIDAKKGNAILGGLLGAIIDIGAATQGIRTDGRFSQMGVNAGATVFSQDFEREADYTGLYIMARAGRPVVGAPNLWRRMARENPKSITFAGTHPTSAERFIRLEATVAEIARKQGVKAVLAPEAVAPRVAVDGPSRAAREDVDAVRGSARPSSATPASTIAASEKPTVIHRDSVTIPIGATVVEAKTHGNSAALRPTADRANPGRRTMQFDLESPYFEWKIGPAIARDGMSLREVIARARTAYERGVQAREVGWLERARNEFFEATQLHGDEPVYQIALGSVLLQEGHVVEAEAVISAAVLLAPEHDGYRALLSEARLRRPR